MFAGMMIGAVGWGTCLSICFTHEATYPEAYRVPGSDLMGRTTAFNATLFLTAIFGVLASLAWSYPTLCIALFLLGSAVGVRVLCSLLRTLES